MPEPPEFISLLQSKLPARHLAVIICFITCFLTIGCTTQSVSSDANPTSQTTNTANISYSQQAKLIANDGAAGDLFGYSVALSRDGGTALIGAYSKMVGTNRSQGAAYIFVKNGGNWTQQAELTALGAATADQFGFSVALSSDGNTALIGAWNATSNLGFAYIFIRDGVNWLQQVKLTNNDKTADFFSSSVALAGDGNTVVIGAPANRNGAPGAAYIFTRSGNNWIQLARLAASDGVSYDQFGTSVALSDDGTVVLIGTPRFVLGGGTPHQGRTYAFIKNGDSWTQEDLAASDGLVKDFFGGSGALSANGSIALVGAPQLDVNHKIQGAAYIFTRNSVNWLLQAKLTAHDAATNDFFGNSVALSADGGIALVGAFLKTIGGNKGQGTAYIFTDSGANWVQQAQMTASDSAAADGLGTSVALSADGGMALVSAPDETIGSNFSQGAVYVFKRQ